MKRAYILGILILSFTLSGCESFINTGQFDISAYRPYCQHINNEVTLLRSVVVVRSSGGVHYMDSDIDMNHYRSGINSFTLPAGTKIVIESVYYEKKRYMITSFLPTGKYRAYVCARVSFVYRGLKYSNVIFEWSSPSRFPEFKLNATLKDANQVFELRVAPWESKNTPLRRKCNNDGTVVTEM